MSLNLFTRLGNLVRGFMSLFVSGLEQQHPEIAYENAINTMIEKYNKLKNATAGLIRLREDAADRLQKAQAQQHELSAMLEQAMAEGQDDIAVKMAQNKARIDDFMTTQVGPAVASIQLGDSVPMLTTSAEEKETNSSTSSMACTMAGEAPMARSTLAEMSMAT